MIWKPLKVNVFKIQLILSFYSQFAPPVILCRLGTVYGPCCLLGPHDSTP